MPNTISNLTLVSAVNHQVSCNLADEVIILNLENGVYYGLNAVAARVWNLLQQSHTVEEIRDSLLQQYDVDPQECVRHLAALLTELLTYGLVEIREYDRPDTFAAFPPIGVGK